MKDYPVDFVIIWVDGSDPIWLAEKNKYLVLQNPDADIDVRDIRYRDWDILKYWFRGVEKYANWVNKVYFITCGQTPQWLNLESQKLIFVKHEDYISKEYLPTFSSHPIELNLHKINNLSEHFVYFNDDMFLLKPVKKELFFRNGLPVHPARFSYVQTRENGVYPYILLNDMFLINRHFTPSTLSTKERSKWLSIRTNKLKDLIKNIAYCLVGNYAYIGFGNEHLPVPCLKSTMETIWEKEGEVLTSTTSHRFRDMRDVNQYIFRYWDLCSGKFVPIRKERLGKCVSIQNHVEVACADIRKQAYPMICLNEGDAFDDQLFQQMKNEIIQAFEAILPEKSSFEI